MTAMSKATVSTDAKNREVSRTLTDIKKNQEHANSSMLLIMYMVVLTSVVFFCFAVMANYTAPIRSMEDSLTIRINEFIFNKNIKSSETGSKTTDSKTTDSKASGTKVLVYDGKQKYVTWPDPPSKDEYPSVARYIMHISEFCSLATNSTHEGIEGYPFVNIFSVSDGPFNKSTGVPYFYFTPLELSVIDLKADNKASLTLSEAQSDYCSKKGYDPEDPRCSHVIFTGIIVKVEADSEEEKFAKNALFSRHAEMSSWPSGHNWFFAKMEIQHIYLLDYFGGVKVVNVEDYFKANPFQKKN